MRSVKKGLNLYIVSGLESKKVYVSCLMLRVDLRHLKKEVIGDVPGIYRIGINTDSLSMIAGLSSGKLGT